jgi:PAS domain S-box-containing protein
MSLSPSTWPDWAQYVLACAAVAVALGARWLLTPILGSAAPFITVFMALMLLVLTVRPAPFLAAAAVGLLGTLPLFLDHKVPTSPIEILQIALFGTAVGTAALAAWLSQRSQERHRQVEEDLIRRSEELRLVTDAVPALISYIGSDLRYRLVNARYVDWFGRSSDEIVGHPVHQLLGNAAFERVKPHMESALAGSRISFEDDLPYSSGTRCVHADYVPNVRADGTVAGFFALIVDISENKRAEVLQARLAAIVETSSDAILSLSPGGELLTWNGGAERIFGYSAAEAVGQTVNLIVPPGQEDEVRSILARVQTGESVGPYDTVRRAKDGRLVDVSAAVCPIRDATGRIIGASKVDRDITERKQVEQALHKSQQQLENADRRKDEFLATLAHELRNPLASIFSAVELLDRCGSPAQSGRIIGLIKRQLALVVRLIDDLLDVSRITRGTLELRKERLSLVELVNRALEAAHPWIQSKAHHVEVDAPADPLEVEGDAVRLVQVFTNTLSNACKYTNAGGQIRVRIAQEGGAAVVEIHDSGIGIPRESLESVFEMFARLNHQNRGEEGLGIGLALSRRLVELHGGTMAANSGGPGQGSQFTIHLQPAPACSSQLVSTDVRPEHASENQLRRILVVDDNADAADALVALLSMSGHTTRTTYNGMSALAEGAVFRPEVVLLDLGLPDISGLEVCRAIRAEPWGKNVFMIALSGWSQERDRHQTAEAGFDVHLAKPTDLDQLLSLLATALPRRASSSGD